MLNLKLLNIISILQVKESYRKYNRVGRCMGHTGHVTQLDWSSDSVHLRSNSSEQEVMFWNASVCRQVRDVETIREISWASNDCPISWGTLGVWGESAESADICTTARNAGNTNS